MALKKCKECGNEVSTKADTCPNCGAKVKRKGLGCGSLLVFLLFLGLIAPIITSYSTYKEKATTAAEKQKSKKTTEQRIKKQKENFKASIEDHYSKLESLYNEQKFQEANSKLILFRKYGHLDYKNVKRIETGVKIQKLQEKVRKVPVKDYAENLSLYKQLLALAPGNERYKKKIAFYQPFVDEEMRKADIVRKEVQEEIAKREAKNKTRIAKFGQPPEQSAWDGSYYPVERYLKSIANDPKSIDISSCTQVYTTESGWLVGCDYRGKNAFGALIRQSNWFTIIRGQVVQMHDADKYNP